MVVSIPLRAYASVPAGPLAGKIVLDTCNYYPERDGHFAALDDGIETSSELLQSHLAGGQLVKVFNNIFYKHLLSLSRPSGAADRSFLPISGDDPDAKTTAGEYLDSIGYGAVDVGNLADSWRQEPGTPVYGIALRLVHRRGRALLPGRQLSAGHCRGPTARGCCSMQLRLPRTPRGSSLS